MCSKAETPNLQNICIIFLTVSAYLLNLLWPVCVCREKAKEMWEWLHSLEEIKYDHCEKLKRQRYEVGSGEEELLTVCACSKALTPNLPTPHL